LQTLENDFGALHEEIGRISDPKFLNDQLAAVEANDDLTAEERSAKFAEIESFRGALPRTIGNLQNQRSAIAAKMKSAAKQIAKAALKKIESDIWARVKTVKGEPKVYGIEPKTDVEILRSDEFAKSLCRLGAQMEGVHNEIFAAGHQWRWRNILAEAGIIAPKAPLDSSV
jgi:hypothetical protein